MVKTYTAQRVAHCNPLHFELDEEGDVCDIQVHCEVNYGEMSMNHLLSVWEYLTDQQKQLADSIYKHIKAGLESHYLG